MPCDEGDVNMVERILNSLCDKDKSGKGVKWDTLLDACRPMDGETVEDALNDLMDKGKAYEPTLGILKVA